MYEIRPIRKGRYAGLSNWREMYDKLVTTPEAAAEVVRDGDTIAYTGGASFAAAFDNAMCKRAKSLGFKKLDITCCFHLDEYEFTKPEYKDMISIFSIFYGSERRLAKQGNIQYIPMHLGDTGRVIASRKPRVVSMTCTPPDENGYMSRSLWGMHMSREAYQNDSCEELVVTVNKKLPYLHSEGERHMLVHVSEVDHIIEDDYELDEVKWKDATPVEERIAENIAELVHDGDCLQFGQGGLADAIGNCLVHAGKKDLGLQAEVITSCCVSLMESGVVNNSKKRTYPGKTVGAAIVGDAPLWKFLDKHPDFVQVEIDWVNDPDIIRQNDNVVSINNAMEVDLTGQVSSEAIGNRQYTGTGGQFQWVYGSQLSKGGRSFIALNSVYTDKEGNMQSKIKPVFGAGNIITTLRTSVNYIVTEYGVAYMTYKGIKERCEALINIAHPDFRDELRFEAKKLGLMN